MSKHYRYYLAIMTLLFALPAIAGTPKQHPKVTAAPRVAVSSELVSGRAIKRQNIGLASAVGPIMIEINNQDMRLHGIRVPTEAKVKPATVETHLKSLIQGKNIRCITVGMDTDGIPLVACEAEGITNIALKMLQSGFADVDAKQVANTPVAALYTQTARMAKDQKIAIWSARGNIGQAVATNQIETRPTQPPAPPGPKPASDIAGTDQSVGIENLANPNVVTSPLFPPIGLVENITPVPDEAENLLYESPQTIGDDLAMPEGSAASVMSDWMAKKLNNIDQMVTQPVPPALRTDQIESAQPKIRSGGWLLGIGLVFMIASAIGCYLSWRRHRAIVEEMAWTRNNALAVHRQANNQKIKRQKLAFNLEEDLLALSQMLSSRSDIARLSATGPGGDTASDLRSLSIFIPDNIAKPEKISAHLSPELARQLRKITNSVQELEIRLGQCTNLAAEGRLRDRPPALFQSLAQRMDIIAADARSLSLSMKQGQQETGKTQEDADWSPSLVRQNADPLSVKTPVTAKRPALTTRRQDGSSWGQPDWATV